MNVHTEDVKLDCIVVGNRIRSSVCEKTVAALMESMKAIGLINPIMVSRPRMQPVLVAGAHRLEAARRLGWTSIRCVVAPSAEEDNLKLVEIDENLIRNDLSPAERAIHIQARKDIYERLYPETKQGANASDAAKVRWKKEKAQNAAGDLIDTDAERKLCAPHAPDDLAEERPEAFTADTVKKTGRSKRSVETDSSRARSVPALEKVVGTSLDKGEEIDALAKLSPEKQSELIERAASGQKVSAKTEVKKVVRTEKEQALAGKTAEISEHIGHQIYNVILADPPWRFAPYSRETGLDRAADNHYPTSGLDEIKALDVEGAAAKDCVLFLWATAPMLPEALEVMRAWGFNYKSHQIWNKHRTGTGFWFRNKHELLLVGTRGEIPAPAPGTQWASVIDADVVEHSKKPGECYQMIEELFPTVPKLEMFARNKRAGWDCWGNETDKFDQAAA